MKKSNLSIKNVLLTGFVLGFILILIEMPFANAEITPPKTTSKSPYTVLAPLPCIESPATTNNPGIVCPDGNGALQPKVDFETYVQYTINLLIGLSAVVAVVMIIWGGLEYMYSASFSDKKMGLDKAQNAIIGFVLILTSYIILRTIDPRLVQIPNSLVPQIVVEKYLAMDTRQLLLNRIQSDVEKTQIKGQQIGEAQAALQTQIAKRQEEFLSLKDQVAEIDKTDPEATNIKLQKEREDIIVKEIKLNEEIKQVAIKREIESAKGAFNGFIHASQSDIVGNIGDIALQIKQMNINKDGVEQIRKLKKEAITKLGEVNFKPLDEEAKYAKYVIDYYKLDLVIRSTQEISQNDGANYIRFINMEGLEDKKFRYGGKTENQKAMEFIQLEINKIQKAQVVISNTTIKTELQKLVDSLTDKANENPVLNPPKK